MRKMFQNKKGFTLIEVMAIIIVLAIILIITVQNVTKQVGASSEKSFYISVRNLTDNIKPINLLENNDYCMYNYSTDDKNQTELIEKMYVLAHLEDNKMVYSVYARSNEGKIIDTYDISRLNDMEPEKWEEEKKENSSYSFYALSLYLNYYTGNAEDISSNVIENFKVCEFKK